MKKRATELAANVHVGTEAPDYSVLNALLAGIELGKASAATKQGHWGPNTELKDGILHVTLKPKSV